MSQIARLAPGWPGLTPRWTSSAKTGVGTARSTSSLVWFTLSHGVFDEIYFPQVDLACVRDMGMLVSDGRAFFSEEKRDTTSEVSYPEPGVPAYKLANTCKQGRYRIDKEIIADPQRDVVLQKTRFVPLLGELADYHVYVLLSPHLGNRGSGNTGWVGQYKSQPVLYAQRGSYALCLASSAPWLKRSVGFAGNSDGWQDVSRNKQLTQTYDRAENGNVALIGEIDLQACKGEFLLAVGFGHHDTSAALRAITSIQNGYEHALKHYVEGWRNWQNGLVKLEGQPESQRDLYRTSTMVLRLHEAKHVEGGSIASLSIPWGFARTDDDLGGYHLVWPRDMVETAGALLAAGAHDDARRVICYLQATQEADGHWPQNMWLDGMPYWEGIQMDETAFPILLVDLARRHGALREGDLERFWPMVQKAAGFLIRNGPVTQEDRWEEDPGYSPFTVSVEIAGLLAAAELADLTRHPQIAQFLRETADTWYSSIDQWTYVTGTELAKKVGVEGYYVRIAPPDTSDAAVPSQGFVPIRNRPPGQSNVAASELVSPDALSLVRFGLRKADDPRIVNTVKVIDALLKAETPYGPAWYRYNEDGYGEKADGSPFNGIGVGRPWPLLTGERALYELALGRREEAVRLLRAMEAFANDGGMLPEQIWDGPDIPARELFWGRASGSAMPLVWAHAEYIKLRRSLQDGQLFDLPPQTVTRYLVEKNDSPRVIWSFNHKIRTQRAGKQLRLQMLSPATVHWSIDSWKTVQNTASQDTGRGVHLADLPTADMPAGTPIVFTFYWLTPSKWEGKDYQVAVTE